MLDLIVNSSITHTLLLVLPVGCAALLRWARCPGWPTAGGVIAGILLGPSILGGVAPDLYEQLFVGGAEQREARDQLLGRQGTDLVAARAARMDDDRLARLHERHAEELADAERTLADARWRFQRPFRSYTSLAVVLLLLAAGQLRQPRAGPRTSGLAVMSIGLWSAAVPGALAYTAMVWLWSVPPGEAALVAAALAIGPAALHTIDRDAADDAEVGGARLMERAGRVASILALPVVAWSLMTRLGGEGLVWAVPLLALPAGWILPVAPRQAVASAMFEWVLVPLIACGAAVRTDLFRDTAVWPILVALVLSGDGRWVGAFLGAVLPGGRRGLRTMRLVLPAMACAPTQLAVTAIAVHAWAIPAAWAFALVLGAVLAEVATPARRSMARRLANVEEELTE